MGSNALCETQTNDMGENSMLNVRKQSLRHLDKAYKACVTSRGESFSRYSGQLG